MWTAYIDGRYVPVEEAKVPVADRGLLYGDGIFATVKVQNGQPLHLSDHLKRLAKQCGRIGILMPPLSEAIIQQLIDQNPPTPLLRLRIVVTGGCRFPFDLKPREGSVAAFVQPFTPYEGAGLRLAIFSHPLELVHAHLKTLSNYNRFFVIQEAKDRGFDDGLSLSYEGYLLEASFGNLFWIVKDTLFYPDPSLPLYFGLTLEKVLEAFEGEKRPVKAKLDDIPDEALLYRTNTMGGILPIAQIENRLFQIIPYPEKEGRLSLSSK
jgi:branched-subunit amino acid aminotransferase/4-amino-4-deoxychorismate lyase